MKLSTKLALIYSILFFAVINLFGAWMIFDVHHTELTNAAFDANDQTSNLVNLLENSPSGSLTSNLMNAFSGMTAYTRGAEVVDADGKVAASSLTRTLDVTEEMLSPGDVLIQKVQRNASGDDLLISSALQYQGKSYVLIYVTDITKIYQARRRYVRSLLLFDAIGGVLIAALILLISRGISRPLADLTARVNRIAGGDFTASLPSAAAITEVQELSRSVGIMQGQIAERIHELQQKNEEQERFIGSLTHEIRTPLTSIIGYSSLLIGNSSDPQTKESLQMIHASGVRIQELTQSLIRLLTVDREELRREPTDLRALCSDVLRQYVQKAEEKGVTLAAEYHGSSEAITDPGLLSILLSNLVDNAIKAVDGCEEKKVVLSCSEGRVMVCDTGKGIPKEDISKIFEPFFMVDRSRKHSLGGFGLGLAICAKIRDALRLQMEIQSEVGKGTEVTVQFPS